MFFRLVILLSCTTLCHGLNKLLITTGRVSNKSEVLDLSETGSSFTCSNLEAFPVHVYFANGGLIRGYQPFVCGGVTVDHNKIQDCYIVGNLSVQATLMEERH